MVKKISNERGRKVAVPHFGVSERSVRLITPSNLTSSFRDHRALDLVRQRAQVLGEACEHLTLVRVGRQIADQLAFGSSPDGADSPASVRPG